jgi:hypothetical protein
MMSSFMKTESLLIIISGEVLSIHEGWQRSEAGAVRDEAISWSALAKHRGSSAAAALGQS